MKKINKITFFVLIFALGILLTSTNIGFADKRVGTPDVLNKAAELIHEQFDGNTIANWLANDGLIVSHRKTGNSGMEWPKGSGKTIDYASGLWLVGKTADGDIRTAKAEYSSEYVPGPYGSDPDDPANRIYIINSDGTGDYDSWPVDQGAPVNDDGTPKLIGDQTMFWVMNDGDEAQHANVDGTKPMGIEVRCTIFGFNKTDPLGNVMFMQFEILKKSDVVLDSCFIALWDDPDLGDASDDLVACDTTLSLGYCYNGGPVDATYGTTPPAIGMDFFQGPEVPPGSGNYLPMTSFGYFWNGAPDPYGDPENAIETFNFLKGFLSDGTSNVDENGNPTKFIFAGDPVAETGSLDSSPADRRFLMCSGPFTLNPGDRQVVVGSKIIAPGTDNKSSITALKFFDSYAQNAFDNDFDLPQPPPPTTSVSNLDELIVLNWQDDNSKFEEIESYEFSGYNFEGYNVYQGESEAGPWKLIATFDVVNEFGIVFDNVFDPETGLVLDQPVAFGSNSGITRNFTIDSDKLTGLPLYNSKHYYFSVTSYALNNDVSPKVAESGRLVLVSAPSKAPLGEAATVQHGDMLDGEHVSGVSNGRLEAMVVDPAAVTNDTYQITFEALEDGGTQWYVSNKTTGERLGGPYTNQDGGEDYPVFDGLKFYVYGAPLAFAGDGDGIVETHFAGEKLTEDQYDAAGAPYGGNKVWHSLNSSNDIMRYLVSSNVTGGIDRLMRFIQYAVPYDFELRFTDEGGYGVHAFENDMICTVPFELWNIGSATPDDPSDDYRMIPFILQNGDETLAEWGTLTGTEGYWGYPAFDVIYWMDPEGVDGYDKFAQQCVNDGGAGATYDYANDGSTYGYWTDQSDGFVYPIGRFMIAEYTETGAPPPSGTIIRMFTTKPNAPTDVFELQAPEYLVSAEVAKKNLDLINIVPNPYWAWSPNETQPTTRIIRVTNLPKEGATIRIFDLAGNLVRVIDDADREAQGSLGTAMAEWDARNAADVPVASGMYLVHVEIDGVGEKVLKLAIVNRDERLIYY